MQRAFKLVLIALVTFNTSVNLASNCSSQMENLLSEKRHRSYEVRSIFKSYDIDSLKKNITTLKKDIDQQLQEAPLEEALTQVDEWIKHTNLDPERGYLPGGSPTFNVQNVDELISDYLVKDEGANLLVNITGNLASLKMLFEMIMNGTFDDDYSKAFKYAVAWSTNYRILGQLTNLKAEIDSLPRSLHHYFINDPKAARKLKVYSQLKRQFGDFDIPHILPAAERMTETEKKFAQYVAEANNGITNYIEKNSFFVDDTSIKNMTEGYYSFVQLTELKGVRTSEIKRYTHTGIAFGEDALSAGEIHLSPGEDGINKIVKINNQSGTYHPPKESLTLAILELMKSNTLADEVTIEFLEGSFGRFSKNSFILQTK